MDLILIPARSGSSRVKNKNLRLIHGRPLLSYIVETAKAVSDVRVIVSTDSLEIAETARKYGAEVPFLRPADLSTPTASSLSAILHTIEWLRANTSWMPDKIAFCPPTCPFIQSSTIETMFRKLENASKYNSIVTVAPPQTHPFRIVRLDKEGRLENGIINIEGQTINDIERTQDWPKVWQGSPACRMSRTKYFLSVLDQYGMDATGKTYDVHSSMGHEISSNEAYDIDNETDFLLASFMLGEKIVNVGRGVNELHT